MHNRRHFMIVVPMAGSLLAACSKETPTTDVPTSTTPAPAPMSPAMSPPATPASPSPAPTTTSEAPAPSGGPAAMNSASLPLLQPSEPTAVALGYVAQASQADAAKYKNYAPGQACSNCSLYGAQGGAPQGPCPIFAGKQVLATAWCSAYVKKAG